MNTFNPMLLKSNVISENSISSHVTYKTETRDPIYNILEFNATCQKVDTKFICEYYKLALESKNTPDYILQEGIIGSIGEFFKSIIEAIVDFFKGLFGGDGTASKDNITKMEEDLDKKEKEIKKFTAERKPLDILFTVYENIPDASSFAYAQCNDEALDMLEHHLDKARSDPKYRISEDDMKALSEVKDKSKEKMLKMLKLPADISNDDICKSAKIGISTGVLLEKMDESVSKNMSFVRDIESRMPDINRALQEMTMKYTRNLESLKDKVDGATYDDIRKATSYVTTTLTANSQFIGVLVRKCSSAAKHLLAMPIRKEEVEAESFIYDDVEYYPGYFAFGEASMYGEEMKADTLFINGMNDFNNTTWVDLSLSEAIHTLDYDILEIKKKAFINECLLRSMDHPQYRKLIGLNEAVMDSIKNAIKKMVEKIKELIAKFSEKLMANFRSDKAYVEKYANVIKNQQPKDENATIDGEIFAGMHRVTQIGIPSLSYQSMQPNMKDENTLFASFKSEFRKDIGPIISGDVSDFDPAGQVSIADWCKQYFGCKDPSNTQRTISMRNSNIVNMTDIYDFLYNISKITDSIKKDQKNIEENAKLAVNQAADPEKPKTAEQTKPETLSNDKPVDGVTSKPVENKSNVSGPQTAAGKKLASNNAATYSFVYDRYFTEADFKDNNADKTATDTTSSTGEAKPAATNISGKGYSNSDEAKDDVNSLGDEKDQIISGIRVYVTVASAILKAKMTAVEYIRNEMKGIIRHHVENFIKNETKAQQTPAPANK